MQNQANCPPVDEGNAWWLQWSFRIALLFHSSFSLSLTLCLLHILLFYCISFFVFNLLKHFFSSLSSVLWMFSKARTQPINTRAVSLFSKSVFPLLDTDINRYLDWQTDSIGLVFLCVCVQISSVLTSWHIHRGEASCWLLDVQGRQKNHQTI